jgi:hypothetical protein
MTIDELLSELTRRKALHGGGTTVMVTWEGITKQIDPDSIYFGKYNELLIDADGNYYKTAFQHPDDVKNDPTD